MARPYSHDLRQRALNLLEQGVSMTQVSRLLNISRPTFYKWQHKYETTGSTAPFPQIILPQPSNITDWKKFK
ncbi:MAG: helix-turn-helix domain-containing protein [Moorea sp. SIO3C2]|nr:helix-turn-helix domain-containing protein [Moorena sp. SIO3C2]